MRTRYLPLLCFCMSIMASALFAQNNFENIHLSYSDWSPSSTLGGPSDNYFFDDPHELTSDSLVAITAPSPTLLSNDSVVTTELPEKVNLEKEKKKDRESGFPECPAPENVVLIPINAHQVLIKWNDVPAQKEDTRYQIRYRQKGRWQKDFIYEGNSIQLDLPFTYDLYEFEVRKLCGGVGKKYEMASPWIKTSEKIKSSEDIDCGFMNGINYYFNEWGWPVFVLDTSTVDYTVENDICIYVYFRYCNEPDVWHITIICPSAGNYEYITKGCFQNNEDFCEAMYVPGPSYFSGYVIDCEVDWDPNTNTVILEGDSIQMSCPPEIMVESSNPGGNYFPCPEDFNIPEATGTTLAEAQVGDVFIAYGLPIVLTAVQGSSGIFSGAGSVLLPFQDKELDVTFTNVEVDENYVVITGSFTGVPGNADDIPDIFNVTSQGVEYCVPIDSDPNGTFDENGINSVTGLAWNPAGFGPDSTYTKVPPYPGFVEGDPIDNNYDPNGFDANGNHKETGTRFNPNGCDQNGLDENGQPCNPEGDCPYYWLTDCAGQTDEGAAFADSIKSELKNFIREMLLMIQNGNNDSIGSRQGQCNNFRKDMDVLINQLDYDRPFVFGENDEYFKDGMSRKFAERPKPFGTNVEDRNAQTIALENMHVALYGCDGQLEMFKALAPIINEHLAPDELVFLKDLINNFISRLDASTIQSFQSNIDNFKAWLKVELIKILNQAYEESQQNTTGQVSPRNNAIPSLSTPGHKYENVIAGESWANAEEMVFRSPTEMRAFQKFVAQEFASGKQVINGVHKAHYLDRMVKNRDRRLRFAGGDESQNTLPVTVSREMLGLVYTLILDNITIRHDGATLDAYIVIDDPNSNGKIAFFAENIPFGPGGLLSDESSRLNLVTDTEIKLSNNILLRILGSENTYVSWNCAGFAGMGVEAEVEFCREMLIPLNPETMTPIADEEVHVMAYFQAEMESWSNLMAQLDMDPFAVKGAEQIGWTISEMYIDFNDVNSYDFVTPPQYTSPFIDANHVPTPAWRGFYLKQISASLPRKFEDGSTGAPVTVGANDLIIDPQGFTGNIFVDGILPLNKGNADGWAFSIDSFEVSIVHNRMMGGSMTGLINVPIMKGKNNTSDEIKPEDCLAYRAKMQKGDVFTFTVTPKDEFKVPLWKADLVLRSDSKIEMEYRNDTFKTLATLHGDLNIDGSLNENMGVNIEGLGFEGVQLSNQAPYFSPGTWSMPGEAGAKFAGFQLTVKNIGLYKDSIDNRVSLNFGTKVHLTKDTSGVSAEGQFRITGDLEESEDGLQKWKYENFHIDGLYVKADIKGNKIEGGLLFYGKDIPDPVYGSGFRGVLGVEFAKLEVAMAAIAQFGKVDGYKYFMVDALVNLNKGIPFGAFNLHGFGGGLYHRMKRKPGGPGYNLNIAPGELPTMSLELGESLSQVIYEPDSTRGLGLKAIVLISAEAKKVFNGNVAFEISFNSSDHGGGIAELKIDGNARLMAKMDRGASPEIVDSKPPESTAMFSANAHLCFDFNNDLFTGDLEVFLNAGPLQGSGTNGKIGKAEIHFSKDKWYINVGRPEHGKRLGIKMLIAELNAYFCVGSDIPDMPPLPQNVQNLTGHFSQQNAVRNTGKGFAFGANLHVNTGEKKFLVFYGSFELDLGFDVMVKDYGENAKCEGNNEPIGINGWYASGQVYAYVQVVVGINALGKKVDILNLAVGAVLEARLPNPFWAAGTVGGRYRLLGGLVKGDCRFRFEIGERCQIVGTDNPEEEGLEVILTMNPLDGGEAVSSTVIPEVSFAIPMEKTYEQSPLNNPNVINKYKAEMTSFKLLHNGSEIQGNSKWLSEEYQSDKMLSQFIPHNFLPGEDSVEAVVQVTVYKNGKKHKVEERRHKFKTSARPRTIPEDNIVATYPIDGMENFYREEWNEQKGYIKLRIGQAYLFTGDDRVEIRLYSDAENFKSLNYNYEAYSNTVVFDLPSEILTLGGVYEIKVVKDENAVSDEVASSNQLPGYTPPSSSYTSGANSRTTGLLVLHTIKFGVSFYNRFADKLNYLKNNWEKKTSTPTGIKQYEIQFEDEAFDEFELGRTEHKLVVFNLDKNHGVLNQAQKDFYENLPDTEFSGVELYDSVHNVQNVVINRSLTLSGGQKSKFGEAPSTTTTVVNPKDFHNRFSIRSSMGGSIDFGYRNLRDQLTAFYQCFSDPNCGNDFDPPPVQPWMNKFQNYHDGSRANLANQKVSVQYFLPGRVNATTSYTLILK